MRADDFRSRPFINHPEYDKSCLSIGVQPEYATGDVLLASCYRVLQLAAISESEVDLEDVNHLPEELDTPQAPGALWEYIFHNGLRSPVRLGERMARPLPQLIPLVPALGHFSGVLGRPRSRWNPGRLAIYALASGAGPTAFTEAVRALAESLDVVEEQDDELAVFIERRLSALPKVKKNPVDDQWNAPEIVEWSRVPYRAQQEEPWSPAEVFARDLREVLGLKGSLTRRQWCALMESVLRLGLPTHVLWVCRTTGLVWRHVLDVLGGSSPPTAHELESELWNAHLGRGAFLDGGQSADPYLRRQVEAYTIARLGFNLLLSMLGDHGTPWQWPQAVAGSTGRPAAEQLSFFLEALVPLRNQLGRDPKRRVLAQLGRVLDEQASRVSGSSGPPKNLYEFLSYTLRRRLSLEPAFREHDQGYLLEKTGPRSAPWVVRPGPVLLMAMCFATCRSIRGAPATLQDLAVRFSSYGVRLSAGDLQESVVASDLEALGILVDSPDAGGGRLVLNPFRG